MNIEALVNNATMGCDGIALSWSHAACAKAVPGCFDVTGNCRKGVRHHDPRGYQLQYLTLTPLLNVFNIIIAILQRRTSFMSIGVESWSRGLLSRFQRSGPRAYIHLISRTGYLAWKKWGHTVLDTSRNMVRASICLGSRQIHILRPCRWVERELRMHRSDLSSVRSHAPGGLTGFDISPDQRGHVTFVIHETSIKVRNFVRVGRLDVGVSTGEGVFLMSCQHWPIRFSQVIPYQEMEHCKELARRHVHVVSEPPMCGLASWHSKRSG